MDRRTFLTKAGLSAALVGVSVVAIACGSDDDSPTDPGTGGGNGITGNASGGGHSHSGVITRAQLDAGVSVTILFTGNHTHNLPLSSAEVQQIATGQRVQKDHTDGHLHTFVFNG